MTITLRVILVIASLFFCGWMMLNIRSSKVRIEDSVFWIVFSLVLVMISLFPVLIEFGARITGVQSSQNFLFLVMIFILIVKLFRMTLRLSQLYNKFNDLVQTLAIDEKRRFDKEVSSDE